MVVSVCRWQPHVPRHSGMLFRGFVYKVREWGWEGWRGGGREGGMGEERGMGEGRKEGFREGDGVMGQHKCMYLAYSQNVHMHTQYRTIT